MGETSPPTGVTLNFTYTPEEYADATRLFLNRTLPLKRNMILGLIGVVGGVIFSMQDGFNWLWGLLIGVSAAMVGLVALSLGVLPKMAYQQDPKLAEPQTMEFYDHGLTLKPPAAGTTVGWDSVHRVIQDEKFYVLVTGRSLLAAVPKRAFADNAERERFEALLEAKALKPAK